jgi:ribosomal protein S27AE
LRGFRNINRIDECEKWLKEKHGGVVKTTTYCEVVARWLRGGRMRNIDETILMNKSLPKSWTCPRCGKRNLMGKYKEKEFIELFKTMQHCEKCGYVHIWFLKLTEDFKKNVVDYLKNMGEVDGHDENI